MDRRYIAFVSEASNLVSGDTNDTWDVFVHDKETSQTKRISVASDGTQGDGPSGHWCGVSTSADGRYIAFVSAAENLVGDDTNGTNDVISTDEVTAASSASLAAEDTLSASPRSYPPTPSSASPRLRATRRVASGAPARLIA